MTRRWAAAWRGLRLSLPHGQFGPMTLIDARFPAGRAHARLWWSGWPACPRAIYVVMEGLLWLRWIAWGAWATSARVARRLAGDDAAARRSAFVRLLGLALGRSVPPGAAAAFGLHRRPARGAPDPVLDFVFDHEAFAWHRGFCKGSGAEGARALLADKLAFEQWGIAQSLPVVSSSRQVPAECGLPFAHVAADGQPVFCKPQRGSGGIGGFAAWQEGGQWRARRVDGRGLEGLAAIEREWRVSSATQALLVQPLLRNHPRIDAWQALARAGEPAPAEVATIRIVTLRERDRPARVAAAWLELRRREPGVWFACPLDLAAGRPRVPGLVFPDAQAQAVLACLNEAFAADALVPDWPQIVAGSRLAHDALGALWAVAWDWVATPAGVRLLEGNDQWSLVGLQQATGGLLASVQTGWPLSSR